MFDGQNAYPLGSFLLDVLDKGIKASAVVVAGMWTWFNHKKSRTYSSKPQLTINGEIFEKDGDFYSVVRCSLRNSGQSKFPIIQQGTALTIVALTSVGRKDIVTSPVFEEHECIEPGDLIVDPVVIRIPKPTEFLALDLELRIVSQITDGLGIPKGIEWNAREILRFVPETPNTISKDKGDRTDENR